MPTPTRLLPISFYWLVEAEGTQTAAFVSEKAASTYAESLAALNVYALVALYRLNGGFIINPAVKEWRKIP